MESRGFHDLIGLFNGFFCGRASHFRNKKCVSFGGNEMNGNQKNEKRTHFFVLSFESALFKDETREGVIRK